MNYLNILIFFLLCNTVHSFLNGLFGINDEVKVTNEGTDEAIPVDIVSQSGGVPVNVAITGSTDTIPVQEVNTKIPMSTSGEWNQAGMSIPPNMIVHDIYIYVDNIDAVGEVPCRFTMDYVISNTESRTIREYAIGTGNTAEIHFEAGVQGSNLRFGTIVGGGGVSGTYCSRNWAAFGYEQQQ